MSIEFAIGTYEINLLSLNDVRKTFKILQKSCNYVDTAINYDNDYYIPRFISRKTKIISKISSCHFSNYEFFVQNHLKCLNRKKIDLMLIHSDRGDWKPLASKMKDDNRFVNIGVSNFKVEDLQEYYKVTGRLPYANEIEINPYYTDLKTIQYCKENGIKIIAYAIIGGKYNSWKSVAQFGLGNLIAYVKHYADIIIVRANSETEAKHFQRIINYFNFEKASVIKINANELKTIEPMDIPNTFNTMFGKPTYLREFCYNDETYAKIKSSKLLNIEMPMFEMLDDYKTYLRYKYNSNSYFGDWLSIGDSKFIAVYMWDKEGKLTKVTTNIDKIEVYEYVIEEC